ncbi:hypothetical protein [Streptomyces mesophilus]|uniref:hypothetical protein n=1 Tax=Streptomyces mesophilus TaxID=1775132 RepID=UPI00332E76DF
MMDADVAYDLKFRTKAQKHRGRGLGVLLVAAALWIWAGALLVLPTDSGYSRCDAPGFADRDSASELCDYGAALGLPVLLIALALPLAVIGAALYAAATTRLDMSEHLAAMQELAARQRHAGSSGDAERPESGS